MYIYKGDYSYEYTITEIGEERIDYLSTLIDSDKLVILEAKFNLIDGTTKNGQKLFGVSQLFNSCTDCIFNSYSQCLNCCETI